MGEDILKAIGLSQEELQRRVVDTAVSKLLEEHRVGYDEDGDTYDAGVGDSLFARELKKTITARIGEEVVRIADESITPNVRQMIESVTLQATNQWGEEKGEPITFREYLVQRAERYMTENVDWQGKTREQSDYHWKGSHTRVAHMIHEHLHRSIERAMKEAVSHANDLIAGGLEETVKMKLNEIKDGIKVKVQVKS